MCHDRAWVVTRFRNDVSGGLLGNYGQRWPVRLSGLACLLVRVLNELCALELLLLGRLGRRRLGGGRLTRRLGLGLLL
jgi:hypothetical protein